VPGTITCSRDAVKPAGFYYFTTDPARARQAEDAKRMLSNANYLLVQMRAHFPDLAARRTSPLSNTIYFRHPGQAIVEKYSLATMHLEVDGKSEHFAHVVVMPHVSRDVIAEFLTDLDKRQQK
jgi:histidine decarboxylase